MGEVNEVKCPACFAVKPCTASACEHPESSHSAQRTAFVELPIPCEGDCETHEGPVRRVLHTTMAGSDTRSYCEAAVRKDRERGFRVEYSLLASKRAAAQRAVVQRVSRLERLHAAGEATSPEEQAIRDEWFLRGTLWGAQQAHGHIPGSVLSQLVDEKAEALREFLEKKR